MTTTPRTAADIVDGTYDTRPGARIVKVGPRSWEILTDFGPAGAVIATVSHGKASTQRAAINRASAEATAAVEAWRAARRSA